MTGLTAEPVTSAGRRLISPGGWWTVTVDDGDADGQEEAGLHGNGKKRRRRME